MKYVTYYKRTTVYLRTDRFLLASSSPCGSHQRLCSKSSTLLLKSSSTESRTDCFKLRIALSLCNCQTTDRIIRFQRRMDVTCFSNSISNFVSARYFPYNDAMKSQAAYYTVPISSIRAQKYTALLLFCSPMLTK